MARFMTAYIMDGDHDYTAAFSETENWQAAQEIAEDFVWQNAPNKETAIAQHDAKVDEWRADLDAGRPLKHTY